MKKIILLSFTLLCFYNLSAQDVGCTTGNCTNGKGRYVYDNGDRYIGEFQNSIREGRGVYHYANGNVYRGQFRDNMLHGYGTYEWANGDTYIGEYLDGLRHGQGTYIYADGQKQEGTWEDGVMKKVERPRYKIDTTKIINDDPFATNSLANIDHKGTYLKSHNDYPYDTMARTALVVGIGNYENIPLKNPKNDAIAIAQELQRSGFDVILYTDINQKEMKTAIRDFGSRLKERGGIGLFFYAGHGLQIDGRNYLIPVDAYVEKWQDVEFESIDLARVLVEMEFAENHMNILILDACRDNPYKDEFLSSNGPSGQSGLASIQSAPMNSIIAFSTAPGAAALDGDGENGLYTQELLKAMRTPNLKIEDIFKKVRGNVRRQSDGEQIPWETSSVEDDFYFKKDE